MNRHGSLCTGFGGLDMAVEAVFGSSLAWWSDVEPGPIAVMQHHHPGVPNLGNVKAVDWAAVPRVRVLTAGYPCQPFSNAGKRLGVDDPRHLWPFIRYAIGVLRPPVVVLENVAAHLRRGFDIVAADLAGHGYRFAWTLVRASDVGAPHRRSRLFVVATDPAREHDDRTGHAGPRRRLESSNGRRPTADADGGQLREQPRRGSGSDGSGAAEPGGRGETAADAASIGRREGRPEPARLERRPDATDDSQPARAAEWLEYAAAIDRWERILGVPAPAPSTLGPRGGVKVAPEFAEWLMGVPGRITSVPGLTVNEALKLAGNGVVPQQAEYAIRHLLEQLDAAERAA